MRKRPEEKKDQSSIANDKMSVGNLGNRVCWMSRRYSRQATLRGHLEAGDWGWTGVTKLTMAAPELAVAVHDLMWLGRYKLWFGRCRSANMDDFGP